jgi:hypothetical protein
MQSWFQNVSLYADFAIGRDHTALRHPAAEISTFFYSNLFGPDVYQKAGNDVPDQTKNDERDDAQNYNGEKLFHFAFLS